MSTAIEQDVDLLRFEELSYVFVNNWAPFHHNSYVLCYFMNFRTASLAAEASNTTSKYSK